MEEMRFLIPIDFSAGSQAAIDAGLKAAERFAASVTLLHVFELPIAAGLPVPHDAAAQVGGVREAADTQMRAALAAVRQRTSVPVDSVIRMGTPATDILKVARDGKYDAIILGTHGRTGFRRLIIGSVAEQIVRQAPCPVVTVRATEAAPRSAEAA